MVGNVKSRENEVEEILEKIRPALALDQGNIRLIKVDGNVVYLELLGACSTCPVPEITMNDVIIATLKPKNFRHILMNNEVHESVGGQKTALYKKRSHPKLPPDSGLMKTNTSFPQTQAQTA
ncbi:MAG: hypothetical protein DSY59_01185 [Persephonella sp.]|nr:MAG: hypothetical protein DSY59_01185 [Persephonella sp.]